MYPGSWSEQPLGNCSVLAQEFTVLPMYVFPEASVAVSLQLTLPSVASSELSI
jgi:hypothetical protein